MHLLLLVLEWNRTVGGCKITNIFDWGENVSLCCSTYLLVVYSELVDLWYPLWNLKNCIQRVEPQYLLRLLSH